MPNDQLYWLAAVHTTISPQRFLIWLQHFKTMQAIFAAPVEFWRAEGLPSHEIKALSEPDWKRIDMSLEWSTRGNTHLVTLDDHDYPALLKEISDPPLVLFVQGSRSILSAQQIGMVGARAISPYGEKNADYFATKLSQAGYVITSGLARGIDAASHRAALQMSGLTIAVAGTGLFHTYPDNHRLLAAEIVDKGGALVSEFPLDTGPRPFHFPRRNRIISGLSKGVLVVEAALRSGSLVTARHALEQGREVFAIPGPIQHPRAQGCHALIRQGAKLVECAEDILEEFNAAFCPIQVEFSPPLAIMPVALSNSEQKIYEQVGSTVTSLDEIILRSGLTASEVSSILLLLELQGHVQSVTGGYVR